MRSSSATTSWATFLTCLISHLAFIPPMRQLLQKRMYYELCLSVFGTTSSFLYHASESLKLSLFLRQNTWHKLDNIAAITSLTILCLHASCFDSETLTEVLKYVFLFITIVMQEADPWNLKYTFVPVFLSLLMVLVSHFLHPTRRQCLVRRRLCIGLAFSLLSVVFFVRGLSPANDPLRLWHNAFHVCIGTGVHYVYQSLIPTGKRLHFKATDSPECTQRV